MDIFWNRAGTVCEKACDIEIGGSNPKNFFRLGRGVYAAVNLLFKPNGSNVYGQNFATRRPGNNTRSDEIKERLLVDSERCLSEVVNSDEGRLDLQQDDAGRRGYYIQKTYWEQGPLTFANHPILVSTYMSKR